MNVKEKLLKKKLGGEKEKMRKIGIVMAALVIVTFMVGTAALMMPALAKAETVTTNEKIPVSTTFKNPCAMDGPGELVHLSGDVHNLYHVTLDANGGFHLKVHFQPQGISGTGWKSGDKYQLTGGTQESINGKVGETHTFVNNFRIIGPGPGNNYLVHENIHITVHPDGTVTSDVKNVRIGCK